MLQLEGCGFSFSLGSGVELALQALLCSQGSGLGFLILKFPSFFFSCVLLTELLLLPPSLHSPPLTCVCSPPHFLSSPFYFLL